LSKHLIQINKAIVTGRRGSSCNRGVGAIFHHRHGCRYRRGCACWLRAFMDLANVTYTKVAVETNQRSHQGDWQEPWQNRSPLHTAAGTIRILHGRSHYQPTLPGKKPTANDVYDHEPSSGIPV
jgi:hypothetical protein